MITALPHRRWGLRSRNPLLLPDSLRDAVAWWDLEEASGTRVDATGRGNDLTDNNTVTQAVGIVGNAAQFVTANNEFLSRADNTDLSTGDIDFTLSAWAYLTDKTTVRTLVGKYLTTTEREYWLYYDSATDRFFWQISSSGAAGTESVKADTFGSPSATTWYLVTAWHDAAANQIGIAVNDGGADTAAATNGVFNGASDFCLGTREPTSGQPHNGLMDSTGMWKKTLSASDRAALYNGGLGRKWA